MARITPSRIRKIRKALGMSQDDFARVLWVTYSTLSRWERGYAVPFGLHLRILEQLENQVARPAFKNTLRDPRADDPLFLLYRLLKPLYGPKPPRIDRCRSDLFEMTPRIAEAAARGRGQNK